MIKNIKQLNHIAVIMDGNRRWAKKNGKLKKEGHERGVNKLTEMVDWSLEYNIGYLTVFVFSNENWNREKQEIDDIMFIIEHYLECAKDKFSKKYVKVKIIGRKDKNSQRLETKIQNIEEETKNNSVLQLNIAFNYGGRQEIIDAIKKIVKDGKKVEEIDEELFKKNLYYGNLIDPDLIIRTAGEYRISNFLLWEMAYSEFYFADVFWPDFSKELFNEIINNFSKRERRYGK
jgi:undecaprenyl diphosphate synthase